MVHEMSWKRLSSCNHLIPLNPWVKWNIHGTLHIHILFVEKSKSCRSEKVKYAENVYQLCSTDFRRTFLPLSGMVCMLGKPCRGYHLLLALAPLNGLPLHGKWLWPCCKKCFIVDCAQVLWPTILPLALLASKDENSAVFFKNLLRQWSEDPCFSLPSQNRML